MERASGAIVVAELSETLVAGDDGTATEPLVERIHTAEGVERTLAARTLGEHAAKTSAVDDATNKPVEGDTNAEEPD
ncbi:hypothetical protein [Halorubellus salinus]|uniref:hypothetical protein n=1 Tax=Halorubellus salinus TaxID=755309 RepID=UPI001D08B6AA|nr:hypothetical protein [Halorubellus salinus]